MFWDKYSALCAQVGKTITGVTKEIGLSTGSLWAWKGGREPSNPTKLKIAEYFGVPLAYFMEDEPQDVRPIYANEEHETYVDASADLDADFCVTAAGDSMIGARIYDGDIVFIKDQPMVNNGDIAAVIIDDSVTLKRWFFYPDKKRLVLAPENSKYEPLVYEENELDKIRCIGKAVCFMGKL